MSCEFININYEGFKFDEISPVESYHILQQFWQKLESIMDTNS